MIVISDTSVISNLAAIGQLDLLRKLYGKIIIPEAVYNEMAGLSYVVPGAVEVQTVNWIEQKSITRSDLVAKMRNVLDLGEAEAIALAVEIQADLIIIDEKRGRAIAMSYQLNIIGILGVLLQAKDRCLIPSVKPLILELINQANFRVSHQLYAEILHIAGE